MMQYEIIVDKKLNVVVCMNFGLRVKYTPEIGFNLLKFIPLYHIIRL